VQVRFECCVLSRYWTKSLDRRWLSWLSLDWPPSQELKHGLSLTFHRGCIQTHNCVTDWRSVLCFLHRWRFTFYLYIFTYGVRFLKKVSVLLSKMFLEHFLYWRHAIQGGAVTEACALEDIRRRGFLLGEYCYERGTKWQIMHLSNTPTSAHW
jgi:hypothetical protein